jgi:hypothetical protein
MPKIALRIVMARTMRKGPVGRQVEVNKTLVFYVQIAVIVPFSREIFMRPLCALLVFATILLGSTAALSEKRIFIVANSPDAYGVDRCLANGASCGAAAAAAYCESKQFTNAASYRRVDRDEITGAIPASTNVCRGGTCDEFVAIECAR